MVSTPEANGLVGVRGEYNEKYERWEVTLDDGSTKLLKESNLEEITVRSTKPRASREEPKKTSPLVSPRESKKDRISTFRSPDQS